MLLHESTIFTNVVILGPESLKFEILFNMTAVSNTHSVQWDHACEESMWNLLLEAPVIFCCMLLNKFMQWIKQIVFVKRSFLGSKERIAFHAEKKRELKQILSVTLKKKLEMKQSMGWHVEKKLKVVFRVSFPHFSGSGVI